MRIAALFCVLILATGAFPRHPEKDTPEELATEVFGSLYEKLPDLAHCIAGALSQQEIEAAVRTVNAIRLLHHLPPVSLDPGMDSGSANAALITTANRSMTHHPAPESLCFSDEGAEASTHSNLFISTYSIWDPTSVGRRIPDIVNQMKKYLIPTSDIVISWLIDRNIPSLGHRRWLLNPFLTEVSFGRVDTISHTGNRWDVITGSALAYHAAREIPSLPANFFVACPFNDYPAVFFHKNEFLSFSAIPINANMFGNEIVNFDAATITITNQHGKSMPVKDVHWDNNAYGVPNALIWKTPGIKPHKRYNVTIANVRFGNASYTYRYIFRIVP
ncbi:MAG: hypothetical protein CO090_01835 [Acidobacteria bacterium CG_4_9_14_3_um_filter_49_7]|nr:MAG: hypothetical protein CO090_01835 [Acidobacteria bacterium CG_4_9_14_3_um_filter_49_7]